MRAFKKEVFCESRLSSNVNEKIDEDLLVGGFKSINDLKKTEKKLFFLGQWEGFSAGDCGWRSEWHSLLRCGTDGPENEPTSI